MMIATSKPRFFIFSHNGPSSHHRFPRIFAYSTMAMDFKSSQSLKKEELIVERLKTFVPHLKKSEPSGTSNLQFDRLQPSDQECIQESGMQFGLEFGQFVAREAMLDEEYWTAAWLRAETKWDNHTNVRYLQSFKRQFAEQEFNALKRRCKGPTWQKCNCIIMVRKADRNVKRTVLKSIVGTLDLSMRYLLHGETFPGERVRAPVFCNINRTEHNKYGYVANLCVTKSARRQGIASNMLYFALDFAKSSGLQEVFVHVFRTNTHAIQLYQKNGFKIVDTATSQVSEDQTYLLRLKL